ncbi:phage holin family protein [Actinomyces minihominis]|uniref:phage holin family protein n=1 Tax=Actinomyces minihominis TaxID=2002838 RepID=UPI000C070856|nr:phage holin family protein [Actinomyces minihominis]
MTSPSEDDLRITVEEVEWSEPAAPKRGFRRKPTPPAPHPSIAVLIQDAIQEGKNYFEAQIALMKLKATRAAKQLGASIAMFIIAVVLLLFMVGWVFHSAEVALALVLPEWAAALIVLGIIFVLMLVFAGVGIILALGAKNDAPNPKEMVEDDIETLKSDIASAKEGLDK